MRVGPSTASAMKVVDANVLVYALNSGVNTMGPRCAGSTGIIGIRCSWTSVGSAARVCLDR
jgi:hypothetical protein